MKKSNQKGIIIKKASGNTKPFDVSKLKASLKNAGADNDVIATKNTQQQPEYKDFTFTPWVAANSRFSSDSPEYSRCKGIKLMGWDYPKGNALKDMIEREKENGIVTCAQLMNETEQLKQLGLSKKKKRFVVRKLEEVT